MSRPKERALARSLRDLTPVREMSQAAEGKTTEWKSQALRAYQRRTLAADAPIASCYSGCRTARQSEPAITLDGGKCHLRLEGRCVVLAAARGGGLSLVSKEFFRIIRKLVRAGRELPDRA